MIDYNKQLNNKINRIVKNYNSKIRRLESLGYRYLPKRVKVSEIKANHFEKSSLNRTLRQLQNFNKSGAEEIVELQGGAKITKWQLEVLKSDMRSLRRYYSKQMIEYGGIIPQIRGVRQAVSYARMGDSRYENLKTLKKSTEKDFTMLEQADLNRFVKSIASQIKVREKQKYVLWSNYFTFIEDVGYKCDVPEELLESIKDKLYDMDINDFMDFFNKELTFRNIIDDYELQKLKGVGFDENKKQTVRENFETINLLLDEYNE